MKYLILLLLLVGCSDKDKSSIDMTDFSEKCEQLAKDVKADRYKATAWHDEETDSYEPDCSLDFIDERGRGFVSYFIHHFDTKELSAIEYYRNNKKSI
jgi:major membrane immunogen (membrane-anchored lipoprotein)